MEALGMVTLPSYAVADIDAEDSATVRKRKHAFKSTASAAASGRVRTIMLTGATAVVHPCMSTYYFYADDEQSCAKWRDILGMACAMKEPPPGAAGRGRCVRQAQC